jgi:hypothetical protein
VIYVTDTHPLVFWASDRKNRLGKRARKIFQEVEQGKHSIIVPVVVLEETARLVERKVVRLWVRFAGGRKSWIVRQIFRCNLTRLKYCLNPLPLLPSAIPPTERSLPPPDNFATRSSQRMILFGTEIGPIQSGIKPRIEFSSQ